MISDFANTLRGRKPHSTHHHRMCGISDQHNFTRLIHPVVNNFSQNIFNPPRFSRSMKCTPNPKIGEHWFHHFSSRIVGMKQDSYLPAIIFIQVNVVRSHLYVPSFRDSAWLLQFVIWPENGHGIFNTWALQWRNDVLNQNSVPCLLT